MAAAGGGSGGGTGGGAAPGGAVAQQLQHLVASPFYQWAQGGVVLILLMLVDAAYSGDWSRIGAITKEQEQLLQQVAPPVGGFHLACCGVAAAVSSGRGEAWQPRTAKVLLIGFLALVEVLLLPEKPSSRQTPKL